MWLSSFAKFFKMVQNIWLINLYWGNLYLVGIKYCIQRKSNILACCLAPVAMVKNCSLNYSTFAQLSRDLLLIRFCSLCSDTSLLKLFLLFLLFRSYCSIVIILWCKNYQFWKFSFCSFIFQSYSMYNCFEEELCHFYFILYFFQLRWIATLRTSLHSIFLL